MKVCWRDFVTFCVIIEMSKVTFNMTDLQRNFALLFSVHSSNSMNEEITFQL